MQVSSTCFLVFGILFVLLHTGSCNQCFSCSGVNDPPRHLRYPPIGDLIHTPACVYLDPDHPNNVETRECTEDCYKAVIDEGGAFLILRTCGKPPKCDDRYAECFSCIGHLCNSSNYAAPSLTLICILGFTFLKWNL